ncbi:acyltransferase family protein [Spirosoma koreense]
MMTKNSFDFIRFLFAITVVLRHIIDLSDEPTLLKFQNFFDSYICITGFFVISGFLISKSYANGENVKSYFVRRGKRLLPAYMVSVIGAAVLLSITSEYTFTSYFANKQLYSYLAANIFFLNFLQPCLPGIFVHNPSCAVNGALWTIKVEVLFYLIIPLMIRWLNRIDKKYVLIISIYVLSIIYKYYLESSGNTLMVILSRQMPGFLSYFICGISFYYYFEKIYVNKFKLFCLAFPVFVFEYYYNLEIFRPAAFSIIIFFFAYSSSYLNSFGKYGDFSYGIYIFHFTIIQLFVHYYLFEKYNPFVISTFITVLVLLMSILSWNFIEKPFLSKKRTRLLLDL